MNATSTTANPSRVLPVSPNTMYPTAATAALINAYGNCVRTWSIWLLLAPVDERIVVSEIGEQWSPNTAPANTAASAGNSNSMSVTTAICAAIGNRSPNVPQEVPVANAVKPATKKIIIGNHAIFILDS